MSKIELLAPAGDLDKLKTAIDFGADAVYLAGQEFGMRKAAKNFSREDLKEAVEYVHSRGKKIHVTVNIIAHEGDLAGLDDYIRYLDKIKVDALIVADAGIFTKIREIAPEMDIHISTQASITNSETIKFWHRLGAKRIVLARELSLEEIKKIRANIPAEVELEAFVHGAMCISYSGRCLLSNYLTGRDANHGDCAQSCRWKYHLVEETRPGEYFPIEEDDRGSYIMNSKDLCMIEDIDRLSEAGIYSFKIEGRVKTQYYLATIIRAYRAAIDAYEKGEYTRDLKDYLLKEIRKASHRDFTKGFAFSKADSKSQNYGSSSYIRNYDFIAEVVEYDEITKIATIEQRNRFFKGDTLEVFGPGKDFYKFIVEDIVNSKGESVELANQVKELVKLKIDWPVKKGYMLRKKID